MSLFRSGIPDTRAAQSMRMRRALLMFLGTAVTSLPIVEAHAQTTVAPPRSSEGIDGRFRYMGMGAAVGGLLAVGYYFLSERGERAGRCQPWDCAMPYLVLSGGLAGLFMARELSAQRRAERPRVGDALVFAAAEYRMPAEPNDLSLRDSLLAVATDSGAQVMSTVARSAALTRRGGGLSDIRQVALGGTLERLYIGTGSALWETPTTTGLLTRALDGAVDALAASENTIVAASGRLIRIRTGTGDNARVDSIEAPAPVTSAQHDVQSGNWWITTDSLLLELSTNGTPTLLQRAVLTGQARSVATHPNWIAVAQGSEGISIWPRDAITSGGVTTPMQLKGEPRFAFDLAFFQGDLFVAGGVDGVTRITLNPTARILGSSRQAQYATSIVSDGTALWVADRTPGRTRVLRITP